MFRNFIRPIFNHSKRRTFSTNSKKFKETKEHEVSLAFFTTSILITSTVYHFSNKNNVTIEKINWLTLKKLINEESIKKVEIKENKKAIIYPKNDEKLYILSISNGETIEKKIEKLDDNIEVEHVHPSDLQIIIYSLIPSLVFLGAFFFLLRRSQGGMSNLFKNESKIVEEKLGVKLKDIAGLHQAKADVLEFADIIMKPDKYKEIGTKIPKGILMEGPPGTGKTMLAKAIADNYESNFYLINGSDFIQPILGTGSRKVKDLFKVARENKPAIIFIDEIDAVGRSRNNGKTIGNDEKDNILNSLLVEMDGFEDNDKLLIIGATNRANILDSALLRPGRFDRIVNFSLPDLNERKEILDVYYDKYKIDPFLIKSDLLENLGMLTYGFNGAQLCNLFNEASIQAVRNDKNYIEQKDFDKAIEYVMLGNEKKNFITEKEKEIISYHESGHALISYLLYTVPSPTKVSIIPRANGALGFSQSIPEYEKKLYTREELVSQMMVLMGGRAAEEIIFNTVTNGASDDIQKINKIAREIITVYGMSSAIGLRNINNDNENNFWKKESEGLIEVVDEEICDLINTTYDFTKKLILSNMIHLHNIHFELFEKETLNKEDLDNIFNNK